MTYYVIEKARVHNFADDNTQSMFVYSCFEVLLHFLETESNTAIEWFQKNKMMINPGKFQAIIIDNETLWNHTNETLKTGDKIKSFIFCKTIRCPNRRPTEF